MRELNVKQIYVRIFIILCKILQNPQNISIYDKRLLNINNILLKKSCEELLNN